MMQKQVVLPAYFIAIVVNNPQRLEAQGGCRRLYPRCRGFLGFLLITEIILYSFLVMRLRMAFFLAILEIKKDPADDAGSFSMPA